MDWTTPITIALLLLTAVATPSAHAISNCKAKVNARNGVIELSATGVSGPIAWGDRPGGPYSQTFANAATCVGGASASKCLIGTAGTPESITPPDLCTFYLKDAGAECAAYVKGCTPGARPTSAAKADALKELVSAISFHHSIPTIVFSGVNVQIVSGTGATDATPNGAGNLIVGYNTIGPLDDQTGSHNLIVGDGHEFVGYGGVAVGTGHVLGGPGAVALGGRDNRVNGDWGVVVGGLSNEIEVQTTESVITGGDHNVIGGDATVTTAAVLSGGFANYVGADRGMVAGGAGNYLFLGSESAAIFGGSSNGIGEGVYASVIVGGTEGEIQGSDPNFDTNHTTIVGGGSNYVGPGTSKSAVFGGANNSALGEGSVVVGGGRNVTTGIQATTVGGSDNTASGNYAVVTGGQFNEASGETASVSGGTGMTASLPYEWHAPQSPGYPTGTLY